MAVKSVLLISCLAPLPALACEVVPAAAIVDEVTSAAYRANDMRFLELRLRDYDHTGDGPPGAAELVVLSEMILRGGSDASVLIEIFPGAPDGVCAVSAEVEVNMRWNVPYELTLTPSQTEGYPNVMLSYRFFDSNAFGSYRTKETYVSDDRIEHYSYTGTAYERTGQEILNCISCEEP